MFYNTPTKAIRLVGYALSGLGVLFLVIFVLDIRIIPCVPSREIRIESTLLKICVAETPEQHTKGLSDSLYLPNNWGMLFVFEKADAYPFWMLDMRYPIDILWLDRNYSVVSVARNVTPESYPDVFTPTTTVQYVLETRPGVIKGDFTAAKIVKN